MATTSTAKMIFNAFDRIVSYQGVKKQFNDDYWSSEIDPIIIVNLKLFLSSFEFGIDFIKELNGMFVIIIYDHVKNQYPEVQLKVTAASAGAFAGEVLGITLKQTLEKEIRPLMRSQAISR